MLEVRGLSVGYYHDLLILQDIDIVARPGITAVLGANGVGKSTLLKAIYGFLRPVAGTVTFDSKDLAGRAPHQMASLGVSYIPQQLSCFQQMSVEENLRLGAWTFRRDRRLVAERLGEIYERFPALAGKRRQSTGTLSGGQQRMVEIGRCMMSRPRLLLVDEPTAGLAKLLQAEVYEMLARLRDAGLVVLLVDQEIRSALACADYVYILDLGRNRADGPPSRFHDLEEAFWSGSTQ